jgi:hypothetical protein
MCGFNRSFSRAVFRSSEQILNQAHELQNRNGRVRRRRNRLDYRRAERVQSRRRLGKNQVEITAEVEMQAPTEADLTELAKVNGFVIDDDFGHVRITSVGTHDKNYLKRVAKKFRKIFWRCRSRLITSSEFPLIPTSTLTAARRFEFVERRRDDADKFLGIECAVKFNRRHVFRHLSAKATWRSSFRTAVGAGAAPTCKVASAR